MNTFKKPKVMSLVCLLILTLGLSGCGMIVAATSPADGDTEVAVDTVITVTFNIDANASTVNELTFLVKDSLDNPVEGTVAYSNKAATFTPDSELAFFTGYTVTVTTGVKNIFGQPMGSGFGQFTGSDFSFSFTTRQDRSWGTAELIETANSGDAAYPQVAMDPDGNALAVWEQSDGILFNIYANSYTPTTGWGTPELIEASNSGDAHYPQVAMDPEGNAIAVWQQYDGSMVNICANRYTRSAGWGTVQLIETSHVGHAYQPQVALDPDGNAVAVWYQFDGTSRSNIWANRYTPSGGWVTAALIETLSAGDGYNPQVAMDPDGNAMAVWYQNDGTRFNIWSNRYTPATGWGIAQRIETNTAGDSFDPQIAIDPEGNALAVWEQPDSTTQYNICANRYTPSVGWGTAALIESDNSGNAWDPQIAIDPDGNAIAVWSQSENGYFDSIWSNRYTPGGGWGTAALIETDNAGWTAFPQIAIAPDGSAISVWMQTDGLGTAYSIWSNRYTRAGGWGTAALIESDNTGHAIDPQVAMDAEGNAASVWAQSDGSVSSIWANSFK